MGPWLERRPALVGIALIGGLVLLVGFLVIAGPRPPRILSTVGAAIPPRPDDGAGAGPGVGTPVEASPPGPAPTSPEVASADALAPAPGLLIVHSGTVKVRVEAIPATLDRITELVTGAGGYVAASKASGDGSDASATLDIRVPAAAWDRTLTDVRATGTVLDQEIGSEEVTGQVIDLDARVANLRATEAALQAIMARATKIADILDVQSQLTDTRGEIEQLVAKAAGLRDRAAFGSLSIQLSVPAPAPTPTPVASRPPSWDPGKDAELASGQLVRFGQVGTTAAIWLAIVGIPLVLALLIALGLVRLAWLGARRVGLVGGRELG
jgi:hypothetical protein